MSVYLDMRTQPLKTISTVPVSLCINYLTSYIDRVIKIDIDECVRDSIDCGLNAECININGSYRCDCVEGFYRNGSDCCKLSAKVPVYQATNGHFIFASLY